jgi:hypothetical protein
MQIPVFHADTAFFMHADTAYGYRNRGTIVTKNAINRIANNTYNKLPKVCTIAMIMVYNTNTKLRIYVYIYREREKKYIINNTSSLYNLQAVGH